MYSVRITRNFEMSIQFVPLQLLAPQDSECLLMQVQYNFSSWAISSVN